MPTNCRCPDRQCSIHRNLLGTWIFGTWIFGTWIIGTWIIGIWIIGIWIKSGIKPGLAAFPAVSPLVSRCIPQAARSAEKESIYNSCLSPRAPFVSHFYAWEAKTKAKRKLRRLRNPNPNQSPAASAKGSPQPRPSKRGNGCQRTPGRVSKIEDGTQKGPPCLWRAFLRSAWTGF
jgi:hypothetical protein